MKLHGICFIICLAALLAPLHSVAETAEEKLRIGVLDLKPYGWEENGVKGGIVYDLLHELAVRTQLDYSIEVIPFARTIDMLASGDIDLIISQPHAATLKAGEQLAVMNQINVVVVTRKGAAITERDGLKNKRLLCIVNSSYPELVGLTRNINHVRNYKIMLQTIAERPPIAGGVFSEPAFYYWTNQLGYKPVDFGNIILLARRDDWIFVRKGLADSIKEKVRHAVDTMHQDRVYERIMENFKQAMH
jgi:ABC-type amino acid transport substrate-binding protein